MSRLFYLIIFCSLVYNPIFSINSKKSDKKAYVYFEDIKNRPEEYVYDLVNLVKSNKLRVGLGLVSCVYIFTFSRMAALKNSINNKNNWSFWNSSVSFDILSSLPKEKIIKEIVTDIERKYYGKNLNIYTNPFDLFDNDMIRELKDLEDFLALANKIKKMRLQKFYSLSYEEIIDAQKKIQRLSYMKNLFFLKLSSLQDAA